MGVLVSDSILGYGEVMYRSSLNYLTFHKQVHVRWTCQSVGVAPDNMIFNMEDELVVLLILLLKKLHNRIKFIHYMIFLYSRYLTMVYMYFLVKNQI